MPVIDSVVERRSLDNHRMLTHSSAAIVLFSSEHCNPVGNFRMNVTLTGAKTAADVDVYAASQTYGWGKCPRERFSTNYRRA
jgi:hypothetical protein